MKTASRTAVAFAALALCLRISALTPGPAQGAHYHPDAAKQVRAVQQFLRGDYLVILHKRNYDGYPLFNSHLVEYLIRLGNPPLQAARRILGTADPGETTGVPGPESIMWIMLLWNASLSALAVAVAVSLGRRFGAFAGIVAGTFAAVSPLDVAAAHYAVGDSAAALFALAAVYLAVRVIETGDVRHYILGALATAAAFSTKYNAAEAGIALLVAHLLRYPGRQALLSGAAWRRTAAAAASLALGIVLTSPALLVNYGWTVDSIRGFLGWVADYGLTRAAQRMPLGERLLWSLRENGLLVIRATGVLALAGAAAALALARPRKVAWVIASLPLAHLLIAFTTKPVQHAVHHLPAVLPLFVLAAAGIASLVGRGRPLPAQAAGLALAVGTVVWLGAGTRDELFFFAHADTRRAAEVWAGDSIPRTVEIDGGRAFAQPPLPDGQAAGRVEFIVDKFRRPPKPPEFDLTRFFLEEGSLPTFRNPGIDVRVRAPGLLAPEFDLPLWQPLPSLHGEDIAFLDIPAFYRSPLVRDIDADTSFEVTVVSRQPLERAWLLLRAGVGAARVTAEFGSRRFERLLGSGELAVIPVPTPRPRRPAYQGSRFYRWTGRAHFGQARLALVTEERVLGRYLFNAGLFGDAWRALAAGERRVPAGVRLERAIAGLASGALAGAAAADLAADLLSGPAWDRNEVRRVFGIHPDWLDGLPYVELTTSDFFPATVPGDPDRSEAPDPAPAPNALATRPISVEPGRYLIEISAESWSGPSRLDVRDACGRLLRRIEVPHSSDASHSPRDRPNALQLPATATACSFALTAAPGGVLPQGVRLKLQPDVLGTVAGRLDLLRRLLGRPALEEPGPADYDALLAAGDLTVGRGETAAANALYRAAAAADPRRLGARTRLGEEPQLLPFRPAGGKFPGGIELMSFRTDASHPDPGGSVGLELRWRLPGDLDRPDRLVTWVHAVDEKGRARFSGDRSLLEDTRAPAGDDRQEGCFVRFTVPPDVAAGRYELRVGLGQPAQGKKLRPLGAALPHDRKGLTLGTVTVAPDISEDTGGAR